MIASSTRAVMAAVARESIMPSVASSSRLFSTTIPILDSANTPPLTDLSAGLPVAKFPPLESTPKTHGIHVATLTLSAHYPGNLDIYAQFACHSARSMGIPTSGITFLPRTKELITVIKGPFVHKKTQENFERRHHKRAIKVFDASRETVDLWLRYLKRNGIDGVGMRAKVHEFVDVDFNSSVIKELESGDPIELTMTAQIEKVAAELLKSLEEPEPTAPRKFPAAAPAKAAKSARISKASKATAADKSAKSTKASKMTADTMADTAAKSTMDTAADTANASNSSAADKSATTTKVASAKKPTKAASAKPAKATKVASAKKPTKAASAKPAKTTKTSSIEKPVKASTAKVTTAKASKAKATSEGATDETAESAESVEERSRGETEAATSETVPVDEAKA